MQNLRQSTAYQLNLVGLNLNN